MESFQSDYSNFYDKIYQDKSYMSEVKFLRKIIKKHSTLKTNSILSLGCGTATYELLLAKMGYSITGIDFSSSMLNIARKKVKTAKLEKRIKLVQQDIRQLKLHDTFDLTLIMFNVIGYLTKNSDLSTSLKRISSVLNPGGLLMFDCWHLPAVLNNHPTDKILQLKSKNNRLIRITHPQLNLLDNLININFQVLEIHKDKLIRETSETHSVRFWSIPELDIFLSSQGFKLLKTYNFPDINSKVTGSQWNIFVVAQKK